MPASLLLEVVLQLVYVLQKHLALLLEFSEAYVAAATTYSCTQNEPR